MLYQNRISGATKHITACMLDVYFSSSLIRPLTSLLSSVPCILTWFSLNQLVGTMPNQASRRRELVDDTTAAMGNLTDPALFCNLTGFGCNKNVTNQMMTYLSISNNALSGTISERICSLTNITALTMSNMVISGTLPFCTGQLSKLEVFSFARCGISLT